MAIFSMIARVFKRKRKVYSPDDTPIYDELLREFMKHNSHFKLGS